ncbi:hypothetical protein GCM10017788_59950 [Amycolatopsis acidiphila]|nr:hypothetical protein GCM10017788_59950 [Amycolatopsis acidiphila]
MFGDTYSVQCGQASLVRAGFIALPLTGHFGDRHGHQPVVITRRRDDRGFRADPAGGVALRAGHGVGGQRGGIVPPLTESTSPKCRG